MFNRKESEQLWINSKMLRAGMFMEYNKEMAESLHY